MRLQALPRTFVALLGALLLAPGMAAAQTAADSAARTVLEYQDAATDAFLRNDARAIDTLLADDFTLTDSRGVLTTRADAVREARAAEVRYTEFRNVDQQVRLYGGGTAVVTGRTLIDGVTRDGTRVKLALPFTDTLIRMDGRWRMVASHVSRPPA